MTKIEFTRGSWGTWTARCGDLTFKNLDREAALLEMLARLGVEVTFRGSHWIDGREVEWTTSNMENSAR